MNLTNGFYYEFDIFTYAQTPLNIQKSSIVYVENEIIVKRLTTIKEFHRAPPYHECDTLNTYIRVHDKKVLDWCKIKML